MQNIQAQAQQLAESIVQATVITHNVGSTAQQRAEAVSFFEQVSAVCEQLVHDVSAGWWHFQHIRSMNIIASIYLQQLQHPRGVDWACNCVQLLLDVH
jgi:hypothetical protein